MNAQHASKKDFARLHNPIMIESEDDGIALLKEVLEENPPEERGVYETNGRTKLAGIERRTLIPMHQQTNFEVLPQADSYNRRRKPV
jgi:hypothetical protein